jgi:hypothetical protein
MRTPPYSPAINLRFGGMYRRHLQERRVISATDENGAASMQSLAACYMLVSCLAYTSQWYAYTVFEYSTEWDNADLISQVHTADILY